MDGTDLEAALVIKWLTHVFPIVTAGHRGRVGLMAAILQWLMAQSIDLFVSVPSATAANFQLPSPFVTAEDSSFTNSNEHLFVSRCPLHVTVATDCQVLHQVKLCSVLITCVLKQMSTHVTFLNSFTPSTRISSCINPLIALLINILINLIHLFQLQHLN